MRGILWAMGAAAVACFACTTSSSSSGTTTDAGATSSSGGSSSGGSSSGGSSSGTTSSSSGDSGGCANNAGPVADTVAAFSGYWLVDDGNGSCNHATMLHIETAQPNGATDPDGTMNCPPPSQFMVATYGKALDCPVVDLCGQKLFAFFAHGKPNGVDLPPSELLLLPDGNGGWKISNEHISKTATGIEARTFPYTPSTAQTDICP